MARNMGNGFQSILNGAIASSLVCLTLSVSASATQGEERFARAGTSGAVVRNFADAQSLSVRQLRAGELVKIFSESVGFYEVEVAGGLEVWVYGEYLQAAEGWADGVLRASGSGINMRPRPGASTTNMPIRQKLQRGDKVLFIERQDSTKPLAEDWVKVWSPQNARGWVHSSEVEIDTERGKARVDWTDAERPHMKAAPPVIQAAPQARPLEPVAQKPAAASGPAGASGVTGETQSAASGSQARQALETADELFDAARAAGTVESYNEAVASYRRVIELAPANSTIAELARRRLGEAEARAGYASLQLEIEQEKLQREEKSLELEREIEQNELRNTDHWGRFNGRGWLQSETVDGELRRYLRWGGDIVAEVTCSTGRYDLDKFQNYEIGVMGTTRKAPRPTDLDRKVQLDVLDIYRIEVISGTAAGR